jgi:hypothetical protein
MFEMIEEVGKDIVTNIKSFEGDTLPLDDFFKPQRLL